MRLDRAKCPERIASSIRGSTAEVDYPGLADRVELFLHAQAGRGGNGARVSRERSRAMRERIRTEAQKYPLQETNDILVQVLRIKLRPNPPGERTICSELAAMRRHARTEAALMDGYSLTHGSTT